MANTTFMAMHDALTTAQNRLNYSLDFICKTPIQNPTWFWWQQTRFNDLNIAGSRYFMGFFTNNRNPETQ
jgi:hypothetical protein